MWEDIAPERQKAAITQNLEKQEPPLSFIRAWIIYDKFGQKQFIRDEPNKEASALQKIPKFGIGMWNALFEVVKHP